VHFWRKAVFYVGREADRTLVSVIVGFLKVEIHLVFLLTFLYDSLSVPVHRFQLGCLSGDEM
jgi:hypothetical protein